MTFLFHSLISYLFLLSSYTEFAEPQNLLPQPDCKDEQAERMLIYQRANGGWPQYGGDKADYKKILSESELKTILSDKEKGDATMDDTSTTLEINYLLKMYQNCENEAYLQAAEHGIQYLLEAQNEAGGWPQTYPNEKSYHKNITYNDEAMISVMWIMKGLAENKSPYHSVSQPLKDKAKTSLAKGITCILKTQYIQNGKKTVWCAQHDSQTLLPASARAFEPASLSGKESVGIVKFLEKLDHKTPEIIESIRAAKTWFEQVKLTDTSFEIINTSEGPDRIITHKPGATLWARFYDLETNKPIFMGRDGIAHHQFNQIERERRAGYAYVGTWPKSILK